MVTRVNYAPGNVRASDPAALGQHLTDEHRKIAQSISLVNQQADADAVSIAANTASIATNTANIATNTSNIATNTANIATNTGSISTINTTLAGLGTAATKNVGTGAGNVVQLNVSTGKLPAVDGSLLTNLPSAAAASKSDQQTGTSTTTMVTPAHAQDHDSGAKAWVSFNGGATPTVNASYNVSGVVRNSAGDYTISFTTAFATANYAAILTTSIAVALARVKTQLTGSTEITTQIAPSTTAVDTNGNIHAVFYGRQ